MLKATLQPQNFTYFVTSQYTARKKQRNATISKVYDTRGGQEYSPIYNAVLQIIKIMEKKKRKEKKRGEAN